VKIAMITCAAYSDAWPAFFGLLEKFWPDHPPVDLLTDETAPGVPVGINVEAAWKGASWCDVLSNYVTFADEPFLLMQEDFLISAPVRYQLIDDALLTLETAPLTGAVRVYPCPGAETAFGDSPRIGIAGDSYRISCQATIWKPKFLRELLPAIGQGTASHFEFHGSRWATALRKTVMAWMRESTPWPIEYICSSISRGKWNPDAKKLCEANGIEVDWSHRGFASNTN